MLEVLRWSVILYPVVCFMMCLSSNVIFNIYDKTATACFGIFCNWDWTILSSAGVVFDFRSFGVGNEVLFLGWPRYQCFPQLEVAEVHGSCL